GGRSPSLAPDDSSSLAYDSAGALEPSTTEAAADPRRLPSTSPTQDQVVVRAALEGDIERG
ncbi:unnamed protein product, partial [Amoebophrya sp. A25]